MNIDFNSLRKGLIRDYSELVKIMNKSRVETISGNIKLEIFVDDICEIMDGIHSRILTLGCIYQPNDPDCVCVISENEKVPCFIAEPED
jgi:hypothetical protein